MSGAPYSYSYQWDEMDGYDCMTGAFKISGPNGFVVYVDQRDYGQKPCDYEDQASKAKAEAATKLIVDALNGLLGPNSVSVPLAVVRQVEAALSIQLANTMQPDRERSYEALEALRTALTQGGNNHSNNGKALLVGSDPSVAGKTLPPAHPFPHATGTPQEKT
jgi:hypothetical protein